MEGDHVVIWLELPTWLQRTAGRNRIPLRHMRTHSRELHLPRDELVSVVIKAQHNCVSDRHVYHGRFIPIQHEYLIIWEKKTATLFQLVIEKAVELKRQGDMNWRSLLRIILARLGGQAGLREIYCEVEREAPEYVRSRPNWMAKVRQQLQYHFEPISKGVWQTDRSAVAA